MIQLRGRSAMELQNTFGSLFQFYGPVPIAAAPYHGTRGTRSLQRQADVSSDGVLMNSLRFRLSAQDIDTKGANIRST